MQCDITAKVKSFTERRNFHPVFLMKRVQKGSFSRRARPKTLYFLLALPFFFRRHRLKTNADSRRKKSKQSKQVNIGISVPPIAARGPSRWGEGRKRRFLIAFSDPLIAFLGPLIAFLPPFYCIGEGSNVLLRLSEPG